MLKVKRINLSGFRGIPNTKEIDLTEGSKEPRSFVMFGLNSSGKTSFVDGIEWFLSPTNEIEWLKREDAKERAYPHQAAENQGVESSVEVEFYDTTGKLTKLTKHFDHKRPTIPTRSDEKGFENIYSAFVIRPYFRYLEVIDFVVSTAGEKYKRLAQWMGFESEFEFQEKIARGVHQELKDYEKDLADRVETFERQLKQLTNISTAIDAEVLNFCNGILKQHKVDECKNINEVWGKIPEISKKKIASSVGVVIEKLTRAENAIVIASVLDEDLADKLAKLEEKIRNFKKDLKLIEKIDIIVLYTKALDILTKRTEANTECPVCGKEWEREKLMEHIRGELELLKKTQEEKEAIERDALVLKAAVNREINLVKELIARYGEVKENIIELKNDKAAGYLETLNNIAGALGRVLTDTVTQIKLNKGDIEGVIRETSIISGQIKNYKNKIQPSAEDTKLAEDIEKLTQTKTSWQSLEEARTECKFTTEEIDKFYALKEEVINAIQENIEARFKEISDCIGKYFGILRNDKDIKDIEIKLNKEKGKAAGRTAEIQLTYYNISVKPAYKVLSESLLNSLGLAVYFTCVKKFNKECKFIVLDDIMNSLDIDKRDTLLDLIRDELSDYQIILFTHDEHWFQKIGKRFPNWIRKKIKSWDYTNGPKIDAVTTTREEIEEYLTDSTKTKTAGQLLSSYVEDTLNELCEGLWAEVRHRYTKSTPPMMEELFEALYRCLKKQVKTHSIVDKVSEARKFAPILRNFVSHSRTTSVSPEEVRRTADEWFTLEAEFWCDKCNQFVEYQEGKDIIECYCGKKKLEAPKVFK